METNLKTETTSQNLDDLFRSLGEVDFLYLKTKSYLNQLLEDRENLIKQIEAITNGIDSKNMDNEG